MNRQRINENVLGQHCPKPCPRADERRLPEGCSGTATLARLGRPVDIRQAAAMLGCSPWTIRHSLIPKGLPVFRSGASGKLIFFESQIVRWIEKKQGGKHI